LLALKASRARTGDSAREAAMIAEWEYVLSNERRSK
jgi:hypothetical protein